MGIPPVEYSKKALTLAAAIETRPFYSFHNHAGSHGRKISGHGLIPRLQQGHIIATLVENRVAHPFSMRGATLKPDQCPDGFKQGAETDLIEEGGTKVLRVVRGARFDIPGLPLQVHKQRMAIRIQTH